MTSQYGAYVLRAGLAKLHARMRMHTPTRPGTHVHACTRKHAHTHTHTHQYVILVYFPQQQRFRERVSALRYTYIACLVIFTFNLLVRSLITKLHTPKKYIVLVLLLQTIYAHKYQRSKHLNQNYILQPERTSRS